MTDEAGSTVDGAPAAGDLPAMVGAVSVTLGGLLIVYLVGSLGLEIDKSLSISASRLGVAIACFFASSATCATFAGRLADRLGSTTVVRSAMVPAVLALVALAALVHSWWSLVATMVVAGAANGAIQPAANRFLTRTVRAGRQGLAFGVKQAAIPAATLLSGIAVPAVALTVGWRWAFAGTAVLVIVVGVAFPRRHQALAMAARTARESTPPPGAPASVPPTGAGDGFRRGPLIVLAVGQGLGSAATVALGSFFVLAATATGLQEGTAGIVAAAGSAVCLAVRLEAGRRADRRSGGHLKVAAGLLASGTAGMSLLAVGVPSLVVPGALLSYGAGWGWPGLTTFGVARLHPQSPGRATGILQVGASTGAALGPLGFGFAVHGPGFPTAWALAAVAAGAGAALVMLGRRALRRPGR